MDYLEEMIKRFSERIYRIFKKFRKTLDLSAFKREMQKELAKSMTTAYMAGTGKDFMTPQEISGVKTLVASQFAYLDNFVSTMSRSLASLGGVLTVEMVKDAPFWKGFESRARSYADAIIQPYWKGVVEPLPLPALPGDMTTVCGTHCRCKWDIKVLDAQKGDYDCFWVMDEEAEHCQGCMIRAREWSPLKIRDFQLELPNTVTFLEKKELEKEIYEKIHNKGGKGSGHFNHSGRPGFVGGSLGAVGSRIRGYGAKDKTSPFSSPPRGILTNANFDTGDAYVPAWGKDESAHLSSYHPESQEHAWITPRAYFNILPESYGSPSSDNPMIDRKSIDALKDRMKKRLPIDPVFVDIGIESGDVLSQEGRHRAIAAIELDIPRIPMIIYYRESSSGHFVDLSLVSKEEINKASPIYRLENSNHLSSLVERVVAPELTTKGGKGSGNFGHAGRPGKVGGSAPSFISDPYLEESINEIFANKPLESVSGGVPYGVDVYLISPSGDIFYGHEDRDGFQPTHTQVYAYLAVKHKDEYGSFANEDVAKDILYDGIVESYRMEKPFLDQGWLSVRRLKKDALDTSTGSYVLKTSSQINKPLVKKIVKLLDSEKLPPSIKKLTIESLEYETEVSFPIEQIDSIIGFRQYTVPIGTSGLSREVVEPILKEKIKEALFALKGGKGSGNFGHAGRPGKVGGSASTGNNNISLAKQRILDRGGYAKAIVDLEYYTSDDYQNSIYENKPKKVVIYYGTRDDMDRYGQRPEMEISVTEGKQLLKELSVEYEKKQAEVNEKIEQLFPSEELIKLRENLKTDSREASREKYKKAVAMGNEVAKKIDGQYLIDNYDFVKSALDKRYEDMEKIYPKQSSGENDSSIYSALDVLQERARFEMSKAISAGKIHPEVAEDRYGFRTFEVSESRPWVDLPDTLYHATTDAQSIIKNGIKSRFEMYGRDSEVGLGGGSNQTISLGTSEAVIKNVERALHEAHMVATGKLTPEMMYKLAEKGAGAQNPFDVNFNANYKATARIEQWKEATGQRKIDLAFDFYKDFSTSRQYSGRGFEDPLFFGTNVQALAKKNPKSFKTLIYKSKPKAKGVNMGALSEIRVFGNGGIELLEAVNYYEENDFNSIVGLPQGETL